MDWDRYAVVDVETTGLSPARDRIVEVACVAVDRDRVVRRWTTLVNPEMAIPPRATAIHGITSEMVVRAPRIDGALDSLHRLCRGRLVAAHYARFDVSFLGRLPSPVAICTVRLARALVPEAPNHKNQTLRAVLGIDRCFDEPVGIHRALDDALVTAHVLIECRRRFRQRYPAASWKRFLFQNALAAA